MFWYLILKYLHVVSVIVWLGSGFAMVVLAMIAQRKNDTAELVRVVQSVIVLSTRVFVPASIATLLTGILVALIWLPFGSFWILFGLLGAAATFVTGNFILRPRAEKVGAVIASEGASETAVAQGQEILRIAQFDYVMLFVVVFDMVYKPGWGNWIEWILMFVVIGAGAWYFIGDLLRPTIDAMMKKAMPGQSPPPPAPPAKSQ